MALLKFLKGNYSSLSTKAIAEGQVLICGDTGEMFVDVAADKRIKIGDFVVVSTVEALEALDATVVPTSRLYYVEDGNILARSNGTGWVQINKQKTLAELGGVSATTYATDKAALVKADTDNATAISDLETLVGTLPEGATATTVVGYINEKTAGIASDAALTELAGRVSTAEGEIDVLQAAIADGGSVTNAIADAKKAGTDAKAAADAAQADVDALENKVGTVADGKTVVGLISDAQTQADKGVADAATAQAAADAIAADYLKASDKTELQGNIDKKVDKTAYDAKVATLESTDTTLQDNIDAEAQARKDADDAQVARIATLEGQITGLSGAMHFEGVKAEMPTDVTGYEAGDVIIVGEKEYVFNGTAFVEFGDVSAEGERIAALEATIGKAAEGENPATGLIKDVADNASAIAAEKTRAEGVEAANKALAEAAQAAADAAQADVDAIAADYLKAADKTTLQGNIDAVSGRVTTLEGTSHTHANKVLLDTYTQTEANLADAVAKKHEHANKTVLDGITAEKVSAWDSAESNAKSYTDALANGQVATNKTNIESLQSNKADKATTLAGYGIADAYTKDEVQELLTWGSF